MGAGGDGKPALSVSLNGKDGAPNGDDVVAAKAKHMNQLMDPLADEKKLLIDFKSLLAQAPNRSFGASGGIVPAWLKGKKPAAEAPPAAKPSMKTILHSVTGCCLPGELLALMGPSGSGKTSLLSIIGGRLPKGMKMSGEVLYNGKPLNKRAKRQVGYVMQDDLLYESLTVYETLYFAALLRLPRQMSKAAKLERVATVITALGLDKCKNTIIGSYFRRGISGGERKRVSVGHELLINPSIVLLDEPTSGLDSTTALQLVESLRALASGGRAIITTIHQPSSRLYQLLDKLMLLCDGHVMYYGKAHMAADWFHKLGYTLPYGTNVADFILDLASGAILLDERQNGDDSKAYLIAHSERYLSQGDAVVNGYREGQDVVSVLALPDRGSLQLETGRSGHGSGLLSSPTAAKAIAKARAGGGFGAGGVDAYDEEEEEESSTSSLDLEQGGGKKKGAEGGIGAAVSPHTQSALRRTLTRMETSLSGAQPNRWGASYPTQLKVLFLRAIKTRRFESLSMQDITQFVIVGLLCGLFWLNIAQKPYLKDAQNTIGLLFFELLFLAFRTMFTALFTFPNEYKMMLKERASGMYRLSAFYFARTASDLPMDCTIPTVFIIIIYFMSGLKRTAGGFFANWACVMLTQLVAQSFGLLIGATVMVPKTAQTITAVTMLSMMLVGGFYISNIPVWISWLKYASFIFYSYNLLLKVEYQDRTLYNCGVNNYPKDYLTNPACVALPPSSLRDQLKLQRSVTEWPWEAVALIGFLIFFRTLVYVALRWRTRKA